MNVLFDCDACQQKKSIVIWKKIFPQAGYLCENCWIAIKIRLDELYRVTKTLGPRQKLL